MKTIEVSERTFTNLTLIAERENKTIVEYLDAIANKYIEPKNFESILFLISFYTSIPSAAILSKSRKSELVFCRMIFWDYCKYYNLGTNNEIACFIGTKISNYTNFKSKEDYTYKLFKKIHGL